MYIYIYHDPVMTLIKFMARSTWVAYAFEWGKLLKCHSNGKTSRKLANGQNIDYSENRKWPKGVICPCTGVKSILFKHVYWYMQQISGERLQDHWSSGFHSRRGAAFLFLYNTIRSIEEDGLDGTTNLNC